MGGFWREWAIFSFAITISDSTWSFLRRSRPSKLAAGVDSVNWIRQVFAHTSRLRHAKQARKVLNEGLYTR